MENNQPIIIKRVRRHAAGHHGGAWKIAFADFATAMMAFFLVLWLLSNATPEQIRAVGGYFKDPVGFSESGSPYVINLGGAPALAPDTTLNPEEKSQPQPERVHADIENAENLAEQMEQERLTLLMEELKSKVESSPQLKNFKDQIRFEITPEGLRIQIIDAESRPMFDVGSAQLKSYFEDILLAMADTIKTVPNKISISGHTDAQPYSGTGGFGNWELSAGRANAARRALVAGGYSENQVARVVGYSSSLLLDEANPFNPVNRRIDIVVLTKKAQRAIEGELAPRSKPAAPEPGAQAKPAVPDSEPLPAEQVRQKLNIFEGAGLKVDGVYKD